MSEPEFATLLEISGPGIQPYSARGLTQTLAPIAQATSQRRTINGQMKDLSAPQFRKFSSTISGNDVKAPAVQDLDPGTVLTVHCVAELSYRTGDGAPIRPVVPDSSHVDGDYTFYRPILEMMVVTHNVSDDEWAEAVSWQIVLEEV